MSQPEMNPLAFTFFAKFARFELPLKSVPPFLEVDKFGQPKARWTEFARQKHIAELFPDFVTHPTAAYIIEHPPWKRVVANDRLGWSGPPERPKSMIDLCGMLKRTRNNLFHGDKGRAGSERDENLLQASIVVLEAMLAAAPDVAAAYHADAP